MIAFFADGPLNGQTRDITFTFHYRVPLLTKIEDWGPGYWEGDAENQLSEIGSRPWQVGYYAPTDAYLKTGTRIFVFQGIE
jgi:hypothetical protein